MDEVIEKAERLLKNIQSLPNLSGMFTGPWGDQLIQDATIVRDWLKFQKKALDDQANRDRLAYEDF